MFDWSDLPDDLLNLIASRLYSNVELKRFRSICTSWRSSHSGAGNNNLVSSRPLIDPFLTTILPLRDNEVSLYDRSVFLSRAVFFRVTLSSSSSSKGWLIKSDADVNSEKFRLLDPFSRLPLQHSYESKSLDLLEFTVFEIRDAYAVLLSVKGERAMEFKKVVLVKLKGRDHHDVLGIGCNGSIHYWNGNVWSRLDVNYNKFSDIIVHKRLTYALDSQGVVWWISSDLLVFRYGPSFDETITNGCWIEKSFVECCEELYIVERLFEEYIQKRDFNSVEVGLVKKKRKTVGFKVYKMDEELVKWIEVKNLGDKALVMATDNCFSVLANEFYGCLKNSIYFTDNEEKEMKVFKLDDNGITTMSELSKSCFQMFVPSFL